MAYTYTYALKGAITGEPIARPRTIIFLKNQKLGNELQGEKIS